jgi:hypothetical protein
MDAIASQAAVLGGFVSGPKGATNDKNPTTALFATLESMWVGYKVEYEGDPMSNLFIPIFDKLDGNDRTVVGILRSTIHWKSRMSDILPASNPGIVVVLENACDGNYTYLLQGEEAIPLGDGDLHDPAFDENEIIGRFMTEIIDDGTSTGLPLNQEGCPYQFHIYPTQEYQNAYSSDEPLMISLAVAAVFVFTIGMFFVYDRLVERRQKLVLAKATQSTAIVSSLFVSHIQVVWVSTEK